MNYKFSCPGCGQHYTATPAHTGTQFQCVTCKVEMVVPAAPVDIRPINSMRPDATVMKAPPGHTWDTFVPKQKPAPGNGLRLMRMGA